MHQRDNSTFGTVVGRGAIKPEDVVKQLLAPAGCDSAAAAEQRQRFVEPLGVYRGAVINALTNLRAHREEWEGKRAARCTGTALQVGAACCRKFCFT